MVELDPCHYLTQCDRTTPEGRLWIAVIVRAMIDWAHSLNQNIYFQKCIRQAEKDTRETGHQLGRLRWLAQENKKITRKERQEMRRFFFDSEKHEYSLEWIANNCCDHPEVLVKGVRQFVIANQHGIKTKIPSIWY